LEIKMLFFSTDNGGLRCLRSSKMMGLMMALYVCQI
jgi:hypothetical protein